VYLIILLLSLEPEPITPTHFFRAHFWSCWCPFRNERPVRCMALGGDQRAFFSGPKVTRSLFRSCLPLPCCSSRSNGCAGCDLSRLRRPRSERPPRRVSRVVRSAALAACTAVDRSATLCAELVRCATRWPLARAFAVERIEHDHAAQQQAAHLAACCWGAWGQG
jgi:hypothetical protein